MRKATITLFILAGAGLALALSMTSMSGCTGGKALSSLPPVFPLDEQPPGAKVDPKTNTITITKENITVSARYWRKYELDRRFNVGSMTSPFYYKEDWKQSEKLDVYYITVQNNREDTIELDINNCYVEDNRQNRYVSFDYDQLVERFRLKRMMDITVRNGLKKAREILLEMKIGEDKRIAPGEKVEGFLPFAMSVLRAEKLYLHIPILIIPKDPTERSRLVEFVFNFGHDMAIRLAQPATVRF
ncbi:hypothetical protein DRP77_02575 [Candidatus Poribacteria bacterium]|nr:MAG: hypothetical protein DRP77_02575 [Candidatus Poribacteria bacterium]